MFGTFRDKLKETGTSYKGGSEEKIDSKGLFKNHIIDNHEVLCQTAAVHDSKASLAGLPDLGFAIYIGLNIISWYGCDLENIPL